MEDFVNELNESQRVAVLYDDGPSLVVAGAGSGKTRVLTYKIAHLLKNGYQAHTILALTFTNKAAREMQQRIATITDEYIARYLWMGTFHSIFLRILRREVDRIGFKPDFSIYDSTDSKNLIKTIIKEMQLDDKIYRPGMIQSRISNAKNALISCRVYSQDNDLREYDIRAKVPLLSEIYTRYQNRCRSANAMDFDEILFQTNILLRDNADILEKYQNQFRYVLVDEYQDTNFAQHLIVKRLCEKRQRICVVGDDAQSIYSFRGANIDNMLRFKDNYPDCKIFKLERNYRSTQNIVDTANSLIQKNTQQIRKNVYSEKERGSKVSIRSAYSDYEEGYLVSSKIIDMIRDSSYSYSDFAILYRTNAQSRVLEEAMRKRSIPYKIYGAQSFYQRKEIKDVLAYYRVIVNPDDEESIRRIINYPARGIGDTTVGKLNAAAIENNVSLWTVLSAPQQYGVNINSGMAGKLRDFRMLIDDFIANNKKNVASEIAEYALKRSGIMGMLLQDLSEEGISRAQNVQELLRAVQEFVETRREEGSNDLSLADFLSEVSLLTDQDNDKDENVNKITMMTIHAAKGLEFKNVFIVGMENDLFPSQQSINSMREIEEERRLFYVAITRAMENCMISYAKNRFKNGRTNTATPSCFLDDLDEKYVEFCDDVILPTQSRWDTDFSYAPQKRMEPEYFTKQNHPTSTSQIPTISPQVPRSLRRISKKTETAENTSKQTSLAGFNVGDLVAHDRFGEGRITSLEGNGSDAKATVEFKNSGVKNLLLKYAKLTVIK